MDDDAHAFRHDQRNHHFVWAANSELRLRLMRPAELTGVLAGL
jgi:hypothetical protein